MIRIQRKREHGFRLPSSCICCTRPGNLGNRYVVDGPEGYTAQQCVEAFREEAMTALRAKEQKDIDAWRLRFRNAFWSLCEDPPAYLACYCDLDKPCHGDVIIEMVHEIRAKGGRIVWEKANE